MGIFLGFVPHTTRNCLWYNRETCYIGKGNHLRFDESINDLPSNLTPPNQRGLERVIHDNKFPTKPDKNDVDKEFKFFVYPFS